MTMICNRCGLNLNSAWFRNEPKTNLGLQLTCKMYQSMWRADYMSRPEVKEKRSAYLQEHAAKHRLINTDPNSLDLEKTCPACEVTKLSSEFNKASRKRGGLSEYCKDCTHVRTKARMGKLKNKVYDLLGHQCIRCSFSDKRALQIDHVFGGGNKEHTLIRSQDTFLKKVLADTTGSYQMLCANCNWIKRAERRETTLGMRYADA